MEFDAKAFGKLYPQLREERAAAVALNDERTKISQKQSDENTEHQNSFEAMKKRHEREMKNIDSKITKAVKKSKITEEVMRLMLDEGKNWLEAKCLAEDSLKEREKESKKLTVNLGGYHAMGNIGGLRGVYEAPKPEKPKGHKARMEAYYNHSLIRRASK